jgi:hypothetical protein
MPQSVQDLLQELDTATTNRLNHGGSIERENDAFDAVIQHPESTWTVDVLAYRQRQVHFK